MYLICLYNPDCRIDTMKRTTQRLLLLAVFCFQLVGTHVRAGDPVNTQLEWIEDDSELIKLDWKTTAEWVIPPPSKKKKSPFPDHPYLQLSIEIPNHLNLSLNANEATGRHPKRHQSNPGSGDAHA